MTHHHAARLSVRALLAAAAPLLLLPAAGPTAGCARNAPAELRLTSIENNSTYRQTFSKAYVSRNAGGGTEIVLTDVQRVQPAGDAAPAAAAGTSAGPAVRQVMHLKILWKPQRGARQSHPSYTNAGLHWYVFADPGDGSLGEATDVLEYSGAGFVTLAETAAGTQVTIRNATVKAVGTPGDHLTDPVGPARLTGTFLAKQSPQRVNALLAEVKTALDGAVAPQASAE